MRLAKRAIVMYLRSYKRSTSFSLSFPFFSAAAASGCRRAHSTPAWGGSAKGLTSAGSFPDHSPNQALRSVVSFPGHSSRVGSLIPRSHLQFQLLTIGKHCRFFAPGLTALYNYSLILYGYCGTYLKCNSYLHLTTLFILHTVSN